MVHTKEIVRYAYDTLTKHLRASATVAVGGLANRVAAALRSIHDSCATS